MKTNVRIFLLAICFVLVKTTVTLAQTSVTQAQAIFLFNFTKFVEWPLEYQKDDFVIGVCGSSETFDVIKNYFHGKTVGKQPIKVVYYQFAENITKCHLLFVAFGKTKDMAVINNRIGDSRTLIVTEKTGALRDGSAINFVVLDDKLKFELNIQNANKHGLKVLSDLKSMAISKSN
jgi:hypothetical protein